MILDTNAVSALLEGNGALAEVLSGSTMHHLPVIVLGEYRFGLLRSHSRRVLERWVEQLAMESVILPIDEQTTPIYAAVREQLRRAGRPMPSNDLWIAALTIQHRLPLVSQDEHFDAVHGIRRVGW